MAGEMINKCYAHNVPNARTCNPGELRLAGRPPKKAVPQSPPRSVLRFIAVRTQGARITYSSRWAENAHRGTSDPRTGSSSRQGRAASECEDFARSGPD